MNLISWIAVGIIAACAAAAVIYTVKNRNKGCSGCCSGCSNNCANKEKNRPN
ncbi:MAG: FeoB-associated Cys-rich membrane protein [Christensenellaceae bacterium]|nr:FeoB-associated Cys-rich membrane protein [Christensenellaceae bacterium]